MKRLLDLSIASVSLIVTSPLLAILTGLIRLSLGAPVFFRQVRPGYRGKPFVMYKLRTMTDAREANGQVLPDSFRLTRLGRFLRITSLDELPELWNVIKGDMSLVGPRPLLVQYLNRYNAEQARRHDVRPGITGWAQVNGRNDLPWEDKFKMDVWYIEHRSLSLDIKIMIWTVWKIIKREGINQPGEATAKEFMGTSDGSQS
jgi:sugar transferase EpsL